MWMKMPYSNFPSKQDRSGSWMCINTLQDSEHVMIEALTPTRRPCAWCASNRGICHNAALYAYCIGDCDVYR